MNRFLLGRPNKEKLEHADRLLETASQALKQHNLDEALLFSEEAFILKSGVLGPESREVDQITEQLAGALAEMGALDEAKDLFARSAASHPDTGSVEFLALGAFFEQMGNALNSHDELVGALDLYALAMDVYERARGPEDRTVLFVLQKMVGLSYNLGDLNTAKAQVERVLALDEKIFGSDHPKTAADLASLGNIYKDLGMLPEARRCYEQAITIDEKSLNWDNPRLVNDLTSLGDILISTGEMEAAKRCFERVLEIDETTFGLVHPKVSADLTRLGELLRQLDDYPAARVYLEQALEIDEKIYGPDNPRTATSLTRLGELYQAIGDQSGARESFSRALAVNEQSFGSQHPKLAPDLVNLGRLLQESGDLPGARASFQRALEICKQFLPPDHAEIRAIQEHLQQMGGQG